MRKTWTTAGLLCLTFMASAARGQEQKEAEKSDTPDDTQQALIESVGLLGGLQLYNAYLNIGILADAMSEELYTAGDVYQLLGSVVHPLEKVEKQFDKLAKLKLSKDDTAALARMKKVAALLREQGRELELFWEKGLPENSKKYEAARKAAWKELNALLEIDTTSDKLPSPREVGVPRK